MGASALGFLTENPGLTAGAFLSLAVILRLTLRPGEPPILAFVLSFQWLQAALQVLHADFDGVPLWRTSRAHSIEDATALSLIWVVVVAAGTRIALRGQPPVVPPAPAEVPAHATKRLLLAYLAYYVGSVGLALIPYSGLYQIAATSGNLRTAFVFALVLLRRAPLGFLAWGVLAFEFLNGFFTFFADFKTPLMVLAVASVGDLRRFSLPKLLGLTAVAAVAIGAGVFWTAIKMDYRDTLNQGTGAQEVRIDRSERADALVGLASELDGDDIARSAGALAERIAYVEFFAYVLDYVPRVRGHEDGRLWWRSVEHVFYPRVLFPDKQNLELDTRVTERYTGLDLDSRTRQTSISIGIVGESYVDLGRYLMFAAALFVGLLYGATYRVLIRLSQRSALPLGLAMAMMMMQVNIGLTPAKFLGGHLVIFLGALALWHVLGQRIERWAFEGAASAADPLRPR